MNEASNSIGNLVLHLCGNARQWIVAGVGGAADIRKRQTEFDQRAVIARAELSERLRTTLFEVDDTLAAVDPATLLETRRIQGLDTTVHGSDLSRRGALLDPYRPDRHAHQAADRPRPRLLGSARGRDRGATMEAALAASCQLPAASCQLPAASGGDL